MDVDQKRGSSGDGTEAAQSACSLTSLLSLGCRSSAESLAKKLHTKLWSLGQSGDEPCDADHQLRPDSRQRTWLAVEARLDSSQRQTVVTSVPLVVADPHLGLFSSSIFSPESVPILEGMDNEDSSHSQEEEEWASRLMYPGLLQCESPAPDHHESDNSSTTNALSDSDRFFDFGIETPDSTGDETVRDEPIVIINCDDGLPLQPESGCIFGSPVFSDEVSDDDDPDTEEIFFCQTSSQSQSPKAEYLRSISRPRADTLPECATAIDDNNSEESGSEYISTVANPSAEVRVMEDGANWRQEERENGATAAGRWHHHSKNNPAVLTSVIGGAGSESLSAPAPAGPKAGPKAGPPGGAASLGDRSSRVATQGDSEDVSSRNVNGDATPGLPFDDRLSFALLSTQSLDLNSDASRVTIDASSSPEQVAFNCENVSASDCTDMAILGYCVQSANAAPCCTPACYEMIRFNPVVSDVPFEDDVLKNGTTPDLVSSELEKTQQLQRYAAVVCGRFGAAANNPIDVDSDVLSDLATDQARAEETNRLNSSDNNPAEILTFREERVDGVRNIDYEKDVASADQLATEMGSNCEGKQSEIVCTANEDIAETSNSDLLHNTGSIVDENDSDTSILNQSLEVDLAERLLLLEDNCLGDDGVIRIVSVVDDMAVCEASLSVLVAEDEQSTPIESTQSDEAQNNAQPENVATVSNFNCILIKTFPYDICQGEDSISDESQENNSDSETIKIEIEAASDQLGSSDESVESLLDEELQPKRIEKESVVRNNQKLYLDTNTHLEAEVKDPTKKSALLEQQYLSRNVDEDDDECESNLDRRLFTRSTSLKTGKTPPGTPGRKKIVRFADALGLDLTLVRTFLDEIPTIPPSAFDDLNDATAEDNYQEAKNGTAPFIGVSSSYLRRQGVQPGANSALSTRSLVASFTQPGNIPTFLEVVKKQHVCLETATMFEEMTIRGVIRVLNIDFHKSVIVRYTTDEWASHNDVPAVYVPYSCDGLTDRFTFSLLVHLLQPGQRLIFALCYRVAGREIWDSNNGINYVFQCISSSNLPAIALQSPTDTLLPYM